MPLKTQRPQPRRSRARHLPANLADADRHVGAVDVAHHDHRREDQRRIEGMEPRQAVENALAMLVAELVAGDERDEQEPQQHGDDEHPHQRVAVVRAGGRHVDDVPRAEPREDHHQSRPERAEVVGERTRNRRGVSAGGRVRHGDGHLEDRSGPVPCGGQVPHRLEVGGYVGSRLALSSARRRCRGREEDLFGQEPRVCPRGEPMVRDPAT